MTGGKKGFTLIEVLVGLTLFAVVSTIAADLFLTFQRVSRKTESLEVLTANARFVVERIAREVREGRIDYVRYAQEGLSTESQPLFLRTRGNEPLAFQHIEDALVMVTGSNDTSEALTASEVRVRKADFVIAPTSDPFEFNNITGTFPSNEQPRVRIFLLLDNNLLDTDRNYTRYDVQTTISSRVYRR